MAWYNLFHTDYGLMSLGAIVLVIAMGIYFSWKFRKLMNQKPGEKTGW